MCGQLELCRNSRRGDGARSGQVPVGVDRGDVLGVVSWRNPLPGWVVSWRGLETRASAGYPTFVGSLRR